MGILLASVRGVERALREERMRWAAAESPSLEALAPIRGEAV